MSQIFIFLSLSHELYFYLQASPYSFLQLSHFTKHITIRIITYKHNNKNHNIYNIYDSKVTQIIVSTLKNKTHFQHTQQS